MKFKTILKALLPLLIIGTGAALALTVANLAPTAERKPFKKPVPVVEVQTLEPRPTRSVIEATGIVTAAQEVMVTPQVTGQVVYMSKSLVPGGKVKQGEVLARIDARDYQLALEQQQGMVRGAELEVERENAQQALAKHEWKLLGEQGDAPPLFSRKSQLAAAKANLDSGQSSLARAKLDLSRTVLQAPFDATVVEENVDIGQVVSPGAQLAHLIGIDDLWVMVSVPVEQLDLVKIPGVNTKDQEGSAASVKQRLAHNKSIARQGQVIRLINKLDDRTRRAQLVVTISGALDTAQGLPLLPGAHVDVEIAGAEFDGIYRLPREAVYEGDIVWVVGRDNLLARRNVSVVWGDNQYVYTNEGPQPGDRLVVTRLSTPIEGMEVQIVETQTRAEEPPAAEGAPLVPAAQAKTQAQAKTEAPP